MSQCSQSLSRSGLATAISAYSRISAGFWANPAMAARPPSPAGATNATGASATNHRPSTSAPATTAATPKTVTSRKGAIAPTPRPASRPTPRHRHATDAGLARTSRSPLPPSATPPSDPHHHGRDGAQTGGIRHRIPKASASNLRSCRRGAGVRAVVVERGRLNTVLIGYAPYRPRTVISRAPTTAVTAARSPRAASPTPSSSCRPTRCHGKRPHRNARPTRS